MKIDYKGFSITHEPKPIPIRTFDYDFTHPDEDGSGKFSGTGKSIEDCKSQIDYMLCEADSLEP